MTSNYDVEYVQLPPLTPVAVPPDKAILSPPLLVSVPVAPSGKTTVPVVPAGVSKSNDVMPPFPSVAIATLNAPSTVLIPALTFVKSPTCGLINHSLPAAAVNLIPATYRLSKFVGAVAQP